MNNVIKPDTWVWVVVQDPGGNEQFLGSQNKEDNVSFIPAFFEKEEAQQCLLHIPHQKGKKYEVQAIFFDELVKDALKNGFMIFMLNADGEILQKNQPLMARRHNSAAQPNPHLFRKEIIELSLHQCLSKKN